MASKKSYNRFFIIFQEEDKGYGFGPDKPPTGYVKVEIKNDKCKVTVYVQNLRCLGEGEGKYRFYMVCRQDNKEAAVCPGAVNVDEYGRGEAVWESAADNAFNSMLPADKFNAAVVIVDKEGMHAVTAPLAGYMSKDKFEFKSLIKTDFKAPEKVEELHEEMLEKTNEQVENKFDEYEENIDRIIEEKNAEENKIEEVVEHNTVPEQANQDRTAEVVQEQVVQERTAEAVQEQVVQERTAEAVQEQVAQERTEEADQEQASQERTVEPVQEQVTQEGTEESVQEQVVLERSAETNQERVDSQTPEEEPADASDDFYTREEDNEDSEDDMDEEFNTELPVGEWSTDGEEFEDDYSRGTCMYGQHKDSCPYNTRIIMCKALEQILGAFKECKAVGPKNIRMWKVSFNKCMAMGNMAYMYPYYDLVFYPLIQNNKHSYSKHIIKHGHYLFGIKYNKNKGVKALVFGMPGKNEECDQPYKGRTGFTKWVEIDKKGYWIMIYDPMTGMVLHP